MVFELTTLALNPCLLLTVLMTCGFLLPPAEPWVIPQPKINVWRALAQSLGQDSICLDTGAAEDPMSSCLVGIPFSPGEFPPAFQSAFSPVLAQSLTFLPGFEPSNAWRSGVARLSPAPSEPTELHLLGSANSSICFQFEYSYAPIYEGSEVVRQTKKQYQASQWCRAVLKIMGPTSTKRTPYALPRGVFLICGDRAWAGIPSGLIGGPCTFGRLTLFTPNITQIINWKRNNITSELARSKRDLKDLTEDCDGKVTHWSHSKSVAFTILLPWLSVAKSLGELGRLECWVVKQANYTSAALYDLLKDEEITRKATLQNRAAIDFLLLLHHHHCEEFEGLYCLNLSSRAEDARHSIKKLQDLVHQVRQETSDWLGDIFKGWGLSGWASSVLKSVCKVVLSLIVFCILIVLIRSLIKGLIAKATSTTVNHAALPLEEHFELEDLSSEAGGDSDEEESTELPQERKWASELQLEESEDWQDKPQTPSF
ncbi:uncharacterized protein LOC141727276 [Zonotrichia albicollis]|uniref:uncharacterized protein LOC141727276 n=1 Tax=Zonotrichia albicollis TaxID=44394 RepID=UPI003D80B524